jgi:transcription termination factor Rho
VAADALEKSVLESKDRDQLMAIANALGLKTAARAKKEDIISKILDTVGGSDRETPARGSAKVSAENGAEKSSTGARGASASRTSGQGANADADDSGAEAPKRGRGRPPKVAVDSEASSGSTTTKVSTVPEIILGPDGEPLAEWEADLVRRGDSTVEELVGGAGPASSGPREPSQRRDRDREPGNGPRQNSGGHQNQRERSFDNQRERTFDGENRNRRRRRRGRTGREDGPQGEDRDYVERPSNFGESTPQEMVPVSGYLDLRDEGYGFLRVRGYLPSKDDAYVSVKQTRQYGLRKGDHVTGVARTAGRNEKNPALVEILTVNDGNPESGKGRPRFEDLTALFPDEKLRLENTLDPGNMTARIIDLISPIGKGQRGIIVSPPKAGKTTIMKEIATAIERNNPEVTLMVLLIDERPEEVTDMRRTVKGEVISSTFDRPSEEHTHVAEMAIEKAKRLVENGKDVVVILDGITRLSRAYNLAAPASGRILSGGIDAGALYPPKKFFGAARNIEEGGSLTILATALVETNSRMDEAIFEEFKGTGNMELRLDRRLAEKRIYPAIDVDSSGTRHEELLFDRKQLQMVWKLRRVLSGLASEGNPAPGLELLIDRLRQFKNNDEFLAEIGKTPTM